MTKAHLESINETLQMKLRFYQDKNEQLTEELTAATELVAQLTSELEIANKENIKLINLNVLETNRLNELIDYMSKLQSWVKTLSPSGSAKKKNQMFAFMNESESA
jgi:hypothetical protein